MYRFNVADRVSGIASREQGMDYTWKIILESGVFQTMPSFSVHDPAIVAVTPKIVDLVT